MEIAAETNRLIPSFAQSAAVAMVAGTNFFLPQPQAIWANIDPPYSFMRTISNPVASVTTRTLSAITVNQANHATRVAFSATRWAKYVGRRLSALRMGAFDFTGLQIPAPTVVDRAWVVAWSYLHPATLPPSVVPSEDGDILFIWHKSGWDLEIEVGAGGTTVWAYHRESGEEWSGSLDERQSELSTLLNLMSQE